MLAMLMLNGTAGANDTASCGVTIIGKISFLPKHLSASLPGAHGDCNRVQFLNMKVDLGDCQ